MYISIKFLGLRGGNVCTKVSDNNHSGRSLMVQEGLEIHVQVTAELDLT